MNNLSGFAQLQMKRKGLYLMVVLTKNNTGADYAAIIILTVI